MGTRSRTCHGGWEGGGVTYTIIEYDEENLERGREVKGIVRFISNAVFKFVR